MGRLTRVGLRRPTRVGLRRLTRVGLRRLTHVGLRRKSEVVVLLGPLVLRRAEAEVPSAPAELASARHDDRGQQERPRAKCTPPPPRTARPRREGAQRCVGRVVHGRDIPPCWKHLRTQRTRSYGWTKLSSCARPTSAPTHVRWPTPRADAPRGTHHAGSHHQEHRDPCDGPVRRLQLYVLSKTDGPGVALNAPGRRHAAPTSSNPSSAQAAWDWCIDNWGVGRCARRSSCLVVGSSRRNSRVSAHPPLRSREIQIGATPTNFKKLSSI